MAQKRLLMYQTASGNRSNLLYHSQLKMKGFILLCLAVAVMGRPGDYYYAPPPQRAELPPPLPPAEQPRVYHAPAEQPRVYPAPAEQPRVYHAPAEQPRAYPTPAAYYYEEPTTKKPCPRKHAPPRGTPIRISFEDHGPPHEEPIPSHGAYYEAPALPPASPPETYVHPPPPQSPPLTPSYGSYGEERSMSGSASSLAAIQGLSDAHASAIHSLVAGHGSTGGVAVTSEHSEATKNLALAHAAAVKQLTDGHRRALDVPQGRDPAQSVFFSMERPRAETAPGAPIRISGPAAAEGLPKKPIIRILRYNEEILEGHHHSFSFDAANGIHSEDTTTIEHVPGGPGECDKAIVRKKGTYSYTSPEGHRIVTSYKADEHGFEAKGDHLPTPPPIPAEIQKSLRDLKAAGKL